jgi:uncharacterized membrane protein YhaH (DUF805 family)
MKALLLLLPLLLLPGGAVAQALAGQSQDKLAAVGWAGFRDIGFMIDSFAALLLAILLGAVIAFHPTPPRTVDRLQEADMPKVYILYAFIGAIIGVTVREFGMVVGFVVFGIGGLMRFRTDTDSTRDTSRLIVVTLAGLTAGLGLPHFAVLTTAFAFVLIYAFDFSPVCRVKIEQLPADRLAEAAEVYRGVLQGRGCRILTEHKSATKGRLEFVFRMPRRGRRDSLHAALCEAPLDARGEIDWEIE